LCIQSASLSIVSDCTSLFIHERPLPLLVSVVVLLPDFGNFYTNREKAELYNPYQGLREFMPWVKQAVSAKSFDWDTGAGKFYTEDRREPREITLDFERLIKIVVGAGYNGYIGVEYEGQKHSEEEGIIRTRQALEELRGMV
jgi:L-ribulose-5-phosphate 3-epimerase